MRTVVLAGERVALLEMEEEDQPHFRQWLSENRELRELINDLRVPTEETQEKWFARSQQPDRKFFSLVTVPERELIGNAGFVDIDESQKKATLRITIGNPVYLGKGLGSEAVSLLARYAFEVAEWETLILEVLETNVRAIKSYEKAGFTRVSEALKDGKMIVTMELRK